MMKVYWCVRSSIFPGDDLRGGLGYIYQSESAAQEREGGSGKKKESGATSRGAKPSAPSAPATTADTTESICATPGEF